MGVGVGEMRKKHQEAQDWGWALLTGHPSQMLQTGRLGNLSWQHRQEKQDRPNRCGDNRWGGSRGRGLVRRTEVVLRVEWLRSHFPLGEARNGLHVRTRAPLQVAFLNSLTQKITVRQV